MRKLGGNEGFFFLVAFLFCLSMLSISIAIYTCFVLFLTKMMGNLIWIYFPIKCLFIEFIFCPSCFESNSGQLTMQMLGLCRLQKWGKSNQLSDSVATFLNLVSSSYTFIPAWNMVIAVVVRTKAFVPGVRSRNLHKDLKGKSFFGIHIKPI